MYVFKVCITKDSNIFCFKKALVFKKNYSCQNKMLNDKDKFYLNFKPEKIRQILN